MSRREKGILLRVFIVIAFPVSEMLSYSEHKGTDWEVEATIGMKGQETGCKEVGIFNPDAFQDRLCKVNEGHYANSKGRLLQV